MVDDPIRKGPIEPDESPAEEQPEDSFVTESLRNLARIQVPATFLPNVMFQVYEKHHRRKINPRFVVLVSFTLLLLSLGFFLWDVIDYMGENSLGFEKACESRVDQAVANLDGVAAAVTAFLSATWDILVSLTVAAFTAAPLISSVSLVAVLAGIAYLVRKRIRSAGRES